ncbi:LPXTG cell wall anchor domain-containing protein [Ligilactobacillus aviarius]|uniref:LPXTG cell wall anchor domain-containing protein n=1 Tax=Ligilactobacillus aviarius TaxID=1606 RepID=UPI001CDA901E
MTFSESKVKNGNVSKESESKNTLLTTGETQDKGAAILGAEAVSLGLALGGLSFLKRKRKH